MAKIDALIERVDAALPQTQCGECDFNGCRPYAEAIVNNNEPINKCPPGGLQTLIKLAELKGVDPQPLKAEVAAKTRAPTLAVIREDECIGCTKCIQACPVDAIIGAAKQMHTVIAQECTGCQLCVEPCPVDCIDLIPIEQAQFNPETARQRFIAREQRQHLAEQQKQSAHDKARAAKQDYLMAALNRTSS